MKLKTISESINDDRSYSITRGSRWNSHSSTEEATGTSETIEEMRESNLSKDWTDEELTEKIEALEVSKSFKIEANSQYITVWRNK